jgi:hypothetical protein
LTGIGAPIKAPVSPFQRAAPPITPLIGPHTDPPSIFFTSICLASSPTVVVAPIRGCLVTKKGFFRFRGGLIDNEAMKRVRPGLRPTDFELPWLSLFVIFCG